MAALLGKSGVIEQLMTLIHAFVDHKDGDTLQVLLYPLASLFSLRMYRHSVQCIQLVQNCRVNSSIELAMRLYSFTPLLIDRQEPSSIPQESWHSARARYSNSHQAGSIHEKAGCALGRCRNRGECG